MSHNVKISRNRAILLLYIMHKVQDVSNITGHTNINTIDTSLGVVKQISKSTPLILNKTEQTMFLQLQMLKLQW